jgi:hypothetical protein
MSCDIILAIVQAIVGLALKAHVPADYPYETQRACLLAPQSNTTAAATQLCSKYTHSERYARMEMVWRSFNYLTLENPTFYAKTMSMQLKGQCCGYGPPLGRVFTCLTAVYCKLHIVQFDMISDQFPHSLCKLHSDRCCSRGCTDVQWHASI